MRNVKATAPGYFGQVYQKGDVFEYPEPLPLGTWMKVVSGEGGVVKTTLAQALAGLVHTDDAHWTKDGKPDLNVLKDRVGHRVRRDDVNAVAADLVRRPAKASNAQ